MTVFLSRLNLELGFDTSLEDWMLTGKRGYTVTLLSVHDCHNCSYSKHSTLATLILLSCVKLLKMIITSFLFIHLDYPNTICRTVWLPDGRISYFSRKLIPGGIWYSCFRYNLYCSYIVMAMASISPKQDDT